MAASSTQPTVTGPITGGKHGWPFGSPVDPVSRYGYSETEYFIDGTATRYRPVGEFGPGGGWDAEPAGMAPFRTRIVVYRPDDAARFNGTVVVSWNNVTSGYDLLSAAENRHLFEGGFGIVGATVQRVGVEGFPSNPQGLRTWDPERYGSLSIPNDDYSFDIFTQAGRAVGPDRVRASLDPMAGLDVRRLIAHGASQSAGYLATYINAIHPLAGLFDGFAPMLWFANGAKLDKGDQVWDPLNMPIEEREAYAFPLATVKIRPDHTAPVLVVNSETEAPYCHAVSQPDTERFRFWEVAGTAHVSRQGTLARMRGFERDGVASALAAEGTNELPIGPVYNAAYAAMHRWLTAGEAPPIQPRIEFGGDPPVIQRDSLGIAKGGVRLPQADAPLAQHSSIPWTDDVRDLLRGSTRPFPPGKVEELYGSRDAYLAKFRAAAAEAVSRSVLLAAEVPALEAEAADEWVAATRNDGGLK